MPKLASSGVPQLHVLPRHRPRRISRTIALSMRSNSLDQDPLKATSPTPPAPTASRASRPVPRTTPSARSPHGLERFSLPSVGTPPDALPTPDPDHLPERHLERRVG